MHVHAYACMHARACIRMHAYAGDRGDMPSQGDFSFDTDREAIADLEAACMHAYMSIYMHTHAYTCIHMHTHR